MTVLSEIGDKTFFAAAVRRLAPPPSSSRFTPALPPVLFACLARLRLRSPCVCVPVSGTLAPGVRRYAAAAPRRGGVPPCSAPTRFRDEIVADSPVERAGET